MKQIAHVDMDAFFVSVEELYNPSLKGKPVVVGAPGDQRGVVAAAGYEARKYGIHSAMPSRTAKKLCPHALFLPPRMELYAEWSHRVETILQRFTPAVHMVSIDEAYLDLTGTDRLHGPAFVAAAKIQRAVREQTHLPCSLGVGTSYLIAKVASDAAKPRGLLWVPEGAEAAFLAPLPVRKLPGIGPVTEKELAERNIRTVGELARLSQDELADAFGAWGDALYRKARGRDSDLWFIDEEQKSISHERTYAEDVADPGRLDSTLSHLSELVGKRVREAGLRARTVTLKLRTADFRTVTRATTLKNPTDLDSMIYSAARTLFRRAWDGKKKIRLLGVAASHLEEGPEQLSLLEGERQTKQGKLARAADRLRDRFGDDAVRSLKSLQKKKTSKSHRVEES